jgi:2-polyprenyl-3-methyl-5-hydroxy-6-metoxy-1,4-benzoquinol methylase
MARLVSAIGSAEDKNLFSLELRPWARGADRGTATFYGGGGVTGAVSLIWADLIYAVDDVALVYQHLLFQYEMGPDMQALDKVLETGGHFEWSPGYFPLLDIFVDARRDETATHVELHIRYDTALLGAQFFSDTEYGFGLNTVTPDAARAFVQTLWDELDTVAQGTRLDPAGLAPVPTFMFAKQVLARAYDAVIQEPEDDKAESKVNIDLSKMDALYKQWRGRVPEHGHILEIGCGDGADKIGEWLERGFQVTGLDVSPASLAKARAAFPQVTFWEMMPGELRAVNAFDAAYSSLMLFHLDPIELQVAIYRLYCALKPGAPFFIFTVVENAQARYSPFDMYHGQRVWQWYYEPAEIVSVLQQQERFVVEAQEVVVVDGDLDEIEALASKSLVEIWTAKRVTLAYAILARRGD